MAWRSPPPSPPRLLLLLLLSCAPVWSQQQACDYQLEQTVRFRAADGFTLTRGTASYEITTTSLNVGFGASGVSTIDIANANCQFGNCPVILKGFNLDKLLPSADSTNADVFCYFGDELPCPSVPVNIRSDELACASPTLPAQHGIVPFGVLVLGASATPPGILYVPDGLELTFFDTSSPPLLLRLQPLASDIVDVPRRITVVGANLGPGVTGVPQAVQCRWAGEEALTAPGLLSQGFYYPEEQTSGDAESQIDCPGPVGTYAQGEYAYLRVALTGAGATDVDFSQARPKRAAPARHLPRTHVPRTHVPHTHVARTHVPRTLPRTLPRAAAANVACRTRALGRVRSLALSRPSHRPLTALSSPSHRPLAPALRGAPHCPLALARRVACSRAATRHTARLLQRTHQSPAHWPPSQLAHLRRHLWRRSPRPRGLQLCAARRRCRSLRLLTLALIHIHISHTLVLTLALALTEPVASPSPRRRHSQPCPRPPTHHDIHAGLACVFDTPNRRAGNETLNASAIVATFISPTMLACEAPAYALRLGETPVYINTTYNASTFDNPPEYAMVSARSHPTITLPLPADRRHPVPCAAGQLYILRSAAPTRSDRRGPTVCAHWRACCHLQRRRWAVVSVPSRRARRRCDPPWA
jgi:hypothetical protein